MAPPLSLGVTIDTAATVRNARGGALPDPVRAALIAIAAGADGITAHLREDRRHIRDADMARLKTEIAKPLNFEMAATEDRLRPAQCAGTLHRAAQRGRSPGLPVHRRRTAADRDGRQAARTGD